MGYRLVTLVLEPGPHHKYLRGRQLLVLAAMAHAARDTPNADHPAGWYGYGIRWLNVHTGRPDTRSNRNHTAAEVRQLVQWGLVDRHADGLVIRADRFVGM